MFEKFSVLDVDSAGRGGEYTVQVRPFNMTSMPCSNGFPSTQAGFGWTNGLLLWVAENYGSQLNAPQCPDLLATSTKKSSSVRTEANSVLWIFAAMAVGAALL